MSDVVIQDVTRPGGSISYHRFGNGGTTLVGPVGAFYSAAGFLAHPMAGSFMRSIGTFADCVLIDRRGLGYSDPLPTGWEPTLERQVDDLLAVLDHARVDRGILLAAAFDAQAVFLFAARYPERTAGVLAVSTTPKLVRGHDHPSGIDGQFVDRWLSSMDPASEREPILFADLLAPSLSGQSAFSRWLHDVGRLSASPDTARRYVQVAAEADVREAIGSIAAPMLVMHHRDDDFIHVADAELLARLATNSRLCIYPCNGHAIYVGDVGPKLVDIERFLTGRVGRTRRKRDVTGWAALTPAQQQVARLVASGHTNAEIAAALGVSTETIKSHVSAALSKAALRSRTELAAFVREHMN